MSEHFRKYIKKEHYPVQPANVRFKTSFRNCIYESLKRRTWKETDHETEWDIFWTEKEWIHDVMDHTHLAATQRVNHFRNYYELCRKDNLIKNLKRHKRNLEKEGKLDDAAAYNFFPTTYTLPGEYSIFCEEFKRNSNHVWIMKPIGKAQGKGIFLFNKLSQVSQWKNDTRWKPEGPQVESYIVQRYINNPLLIGGKKFDMRIYCLVTSYSPLVAYLYRDGFARFTHHRYDSEDITNAFVHLTNVAIQKTSENYDEKIGGKWDLRTLKLYLMSQYGQEAVSESFASIQQVIIRSLQSVQKVMINDKHCFELYGFDVLLDANLKPWLIEVNGSPSMTANTPHDFELKCNLLDDVFTIIDMEKVMTGQEEQIGGFDLICKGTPVKNESSLFSTMLSCHNNRAQQLKKLAKIIASKIAQNYNQEKEDGKKTPLNKDKDSASISTADTGASSSKGRSRNASKASTNPGGAVVKNIKAPALNKQNTLPHPNSREPRDPKELNNPKLPPSKIRELSKGKTFVGLPPVGSTSGNTTQITASTSSYPSSNVTPANGSSSNAHRMSNVVNPSSNIGPNNLLTAKHRLSQPIQGGHIEKLNSPSSMKVPSTLQLAGNATLKLDMAQTSDGARSKGHGFGNALDLSEQKQMVYAYNTDNQPSYKGNEDIIDRLASQDRNQKKSSIPRSDNNSNSNEEEYQKRKGDSEDMGQDYGSDDDGQEYE